MFGTCSCAQGLNLVKCLAVCSQFLGPICFLQIMHGKYRHPAYFKVFTGGISLCLFAPLNKQYCLLFAVLFWGRGQFQRASQVVLVVKNSPPSAGRPQRGLIPGRDDPLEEGTAVHSSARVWRIPQPEEPGGLQSIESHTEL